ncbi:MAG TPA: cytochrome P450 [Longimicrobium sp.]|nr:cytochrome P450 [Longimicrobium sp.]
MKISRPTDSSGVDLSAYDLSDPGFFAEGDPHLVWHAMRHRAPVHWQPVGNLGFWSVAKYADVTQVLKDHSTFTSECGTLLHLLGTRDPASGCQMVVTDPPRHTQMRVPMNRVLTGKAVEKHFDGVRAHARELLEPALSGETFDFAAVMMELAIGVAGIVMELPKDDWPYLTRLLSACVAPDDPDFQLAEGPEATLKRGHRELFGYLEDVAWERERKPGEDLFSVLFGIRVDGEPLTPAAVISNCYSLLLGDSVTTPHVPSAALMEMIRTDAYQDWAAHPEHFASGLEEALRWSSPAIHIMRYATRDTELRGQAIKQGDAVVVWLGSANRDEDVFADPFRYDLRRAQNRHLTFGFGAHYCVGHAIGRMTLNALFTEILETFEGFEVAGPVKHMRSNFIAGITRLPLKAHVRTRSRAEEPVLAGV